MNGEITNQDNLKLSEWPTMMLEHLDVGLLIIDEQGYIVKVNATLRDKLQLTPDALFERKSIYNYLDHHSAIRLKKMLVNFIASKKVPQDQLRFTSTSGELNSAIVKVIFTQGDTHPHFLLSFDCHNQLLVEHSAPNISDILYNISSNLPDAIYRNSPTKGLEYVNSSFLELFGCSTEQDPIGHPLSEFCVDKVAFELTREKLQKQGFLKNETIQFRRRDNTVFWGLVNSKLTEEENGETYFDGAIIDVTDYVKSQEELKTKNQEYKKLNEELDRFLYSVSHDIRSPMTSVMGIVNIMRLELEQDKHSYLDRIDDSLKKLDYFIKDVVQFSENTRKRLKSERVDFKELLHGIWKKQMKGRLNIEFVLNVNKRYFFYSDTERLVIIFSNIIKNAIQYTNTAVRNKKVEVTITPLSNKVLIEVMDNGIGIPAAHIDNVFEMFYRANEDSKGAGLGLYIVKETVSKLKGQISVASTEEEGTTINIELPNDSKGRLMSKKLKLASHRL